VRVVLDTNVLIAAFATRGLCEDVLRTVLAEHELIVSKFILAELERVLVEKRRFRSLTSPPPSSAPASSSRAPLTTTRAAI
jgi:predicted nucleic acid-binding protein